MIPPTKNHFIRSLEMREPNIVLILADDMGYGNTTGKMQCDLDKWFEQVEADRASIRD